MKIKNNVNSGFKGKLEDFNDLQPVGFKAPYHSEITKKSILERGFVQPFAMCEINGELFICDGHLRKDLIYELINDGHQVPEEFSYYIIDVNNDRKKAIDILFSFNTKTNPIDLEVLTEWVNIEQVEVEVTSLNVVDLTDIEEETEVLEAEEDDFDSTPPETPETVLGDLYEIGEHRLLCGDSTDSDQVAKLMNGQKADISFTSPPYNAGTNVRGKFYENDNDDKSNDDYVKFLYDFTINTLNNSTYSFVNLQILESNKHALIDYQYQLKNQLKDILIWNKKQYPPHINKGTFGCKWEYVFAFCYESKSRSFPASWQGKFSNVIETENASGNDFAQIHKATFPIAFPSWILEKMDFANSVLDLFCGTGTTMVASHQLKRKCYGMELDCRYADVIVKRMLKLDKSLKIKKNGIDETDKWLKLIE
jgi:DNA modification methylase